MDKYEYAASLIGKSVRLSVPMRTYTTFRIGGNADMLIEPTDENELRSAVETLDSLGIGHVILGNGSNVLFSDSGYRGAVIRLAENFSSCVIDGTTVRALAGTSLSVMANRSLSAGLMGLEWASGIPGTVGGAVAMNAGAYGGEIKHVLTSVRLFDGKDFTDRAVMPKDLAYRYSAFAFPEATVISAVFELKPDTDGKAKERRDEYNAARREKQPLDKPSAGSTFKRPTGNYAGALIEQAGLKGFRVGGASVSEKHAGFVVSDGTATARDVYALILKVQKRVFDASGILLEPEVKLIGDFT